MCEAWAILICDRVSKESSCLINIDNRLWFEKIKWNIENLRVRSTGIKLVLISFSFPKLIDYLNSLNYIPFIYEKFYESSIMSLSMKCFIIYEMLHIIIIADIYLKIMNSEFRDNSKLSFKFRILVGNCYIVRTLSEL